MSGYEKNHLTVKQWKDLKISETIVVEGERQLNNNEENSLQISIGIGINFEVTDSGSTGRFKVNNCVITKDTTSYDFFEDIRSFGQDESKIAILGHGKNLLELGQEYFVSGNVGVLENNIVKINYSKPFEVFLNNNNPIRIKKGSVSFSFKIKILEGMV